MLSPSSNWIKDKDFWKSDVSNQAYHNRAAHVKEYHVLLEISKIVPHERLNVFLIFNIFFNYMKWFFFLFFHTQGAEVREGRDSSLFFPSCCSLAAGCCSWEVRRWYEKNYFLHFVMMIFKTFPCTEGFFLNLSRNIDSFLCNCVGWSFFFFFFFLSHFSAEKPLLEENCYWK